MKLLPGYSRQTIQRNIEQMLREGKPRSQAIAAAHSNARKYYWKKYSQGFLPDWIYPDPKGGRNNPKKKKSVIKKNPVPPSRTVQVREAVALYENFTGHEAEEIARLDKPVIPDVLMVIGELEGIMYSTVRDGEREKYMHQFKVSSRPLLCASPDGTQLFMLGGAYDFTERGIVDQT